MKETHLYKPFTGLLIFFLLLTVSTTQAQEKTLYQRIGGYDAIAAVTDQFIGKIASDKQLSRFFSHLSDNAKMKTRQLVIDQICAATGGPCVYIGRDMKTAHGGMGITESDWNLTAKYFAETLESFMVPEKEKNELIAAISSFKNDIVEKMEAKK